MAKVSDADMALMARLLGRGEAGEKGAARLALLLDTLNARDDEIGALRAALKKLIAVTDDHMTACDRIMGATHPCTCGAREARALLMRAINPTSSEVS